MKTFKIFASFFVIMLLASTYASASKWLPSKYDLDDQLTRMSSISNTSFIGWEKVDNQSLVLQTTPSRYYLIVLSFPTTNLLFTEDIGITGQSLMIRPGYDNVIVRSAAGFIDRYIINKIYRLEGRKQIREIVAQLTEPQRDLPSTPKKKASKWAVAAAGSDRLPMP